MEMTRNALHFLLIPCFVLGLIIEPARAQQANTSSSIYLKRFVENVDGSRIDKASPKITFTAFLNSSEDSILIETAPRPDDAGKNINTINGMVGLELSLFSHIQVDDTARIRISDNVLGERGMISQPIDTIPWTDPHPLDVTRLHSTKLPNRPQNLKLAVNNNDRRTITWDTETGLSYQIYRTNLDQRLSNFKIHKIFTRQAKGIDTGSWTDPDTSSGNYSYLVYAVDSTGIKSAHSREVITPRPNILLINIDDFGSQDPGFMGSEFYETPNIDSLASSGMFFSNAYSTASNCSPSRAALMTGQYAPRTGVYTVNTSFRGDEEDRKVVPVANQRYIDSDDYTIAEELQQNGYLTAHVGKWHISQDPTYHGFDINIGGNQRGSVWGMGGYFAPFENPDLTESPDGTYLTDRLADEAISIIDSSGNQPLFMYFSTYAVHTPIQPKPALKDKYEQKEGTEAHNHPGYAAMIETMDRNVGRLVSHLRKTGRYENTIIVFTSDHGGVFKITKMWPLRAGKGSYYEGGTRVPLIVTWPEVVEPGSRSEKLISQVDLFPTFLDIASIDPPEGKILDGMSMVPILKDQTTDPRTLYWHFPIYIDRGNAESISPMWRTTPGSALRKGKWKLHQYYEDGHLELYNLEEDPGEKNNLADQRPQKASELYQELDNWRNRINAPLPGNSTPIQTDRDEQPSSFQLFDNYPNPFNPTTTITYSLPSATNVTLEIFDVAGRLVKTVVDRSQNAGRYSVSLNAYGLSSGIYFYRLKTNSHSETRQMTIIK